jgi:hypothetical protein
MIGPLSFDGNDNRLFHAQTACKTITLFISGRDERSARGTSRLNRLPLVECLCRGEEDIGYLRE